MPYIGRGSDNGFSIRNRYIFVSTSGQQDFSGADANSNTLALEDGFLTDVFVNGIMIKPTADYTLNNSTNTLSLVSAASTSDEVTILVYQIFSLSDAMPTSGGTFSGGITGTTANFSGNITGNLVGNASTATALQNARTIGGVSFDGTANINLPGVNATGNQNTSGTAATVTGAAQSAITSVGTLSGLTIDGDATLTGANYNVVWDKSDNALEFADNAKLTFGASSDLQILHNGNNSVIKDAGTGNLSLQSNGNNINLWDVSNAQVMGQFNTGGSVALYHNGSKKFETASTGATVTGTLTATAFSGNLTGNVTGNTSGTAATVTTAAQPNITSVGTLTSATISGDLTVDSGVLEVQANNNRIRYTQGTNKGVVFQDSGLANTTEIGFGTENELIQAGVITGSNIGFYTGAAGQGSATKKMEILTNGTIKTSNISATTTSIANSAGTGSINTQGGDFVTGRAIFTGANNGGNASYLYGMNSEATRWVLYDFVNNAYKLIVANMGNVGIPNGAIRTSPNNTFHNGAGTTGAGITTGDFCEFNQNKNEFILMLKNNNASVNQSHGLFITHATNHFDATSLYIQCTFAGFNRFLVYSNGASYNASNTWGNISDERLKSDIVDAKSQWDDLKNIKIRNFKKYDTGDLVQLGVVAQEVEKVSPSLIDKVEPSAGDVEHNSVFGRLYTSDDPETKPTLYTDSDDIPEDKKVGDEKEPPLKKVGDVKQNEPVKAIKYSVLYMKAVKALQEAMERIETLEIKVKALEEA